MVAGMATVGENIRRLRLQAGMSPRELAERAGLSTVCMIEGGKRGGRVDSLRKIADALGVPMAELFAERPRKRAGL